MFQYLPDKIHPKDYLLPIAKSGIQNPEQLLLDERVTRLETHIKHHTYCKLGLLSETIDRYKQSQRALKMRKLGLLKQEGTTKRKALTNAQIRWNLDTQVEPLIHLERLSTQIEHINENKLQKMDRSYLSELRKEVEYTIELDKLKKIASIILG